MNKMGEGLLKKRMFKDVQNEPYEWVCVAPDEEYSDDERWVDVATIKKVVDSAKKEMGQKLCIYCNHQEYGCNNADFCPRNIAFEKWFGDST